MPASYVLFRMSQGVFAAGRQEVMAGVDGRHGSGIAAPFTRFRSVLPIVPLIGPAAFFRMPVGVVSVGRWWVGRGPVVGRREVSRGSVGWPTVRSRYPPSAFGWCRRSFAPLARWRWFGCHGETMWSVGGGVVGCLTGGTFNVFSPPGLRSVWGESGAPTGGSSASQSEASRRAIRRRTGGQDTSF